MLRRVHFGRRRIARPDPPRDGSTIPLPPTPPALDEDDPRWGPWQDVSAVIRVRAGTVEVDPAASRDGKRPDLRKVLAAARR